MQVSLYNLLKVRISMQFKVGFSLVACAMGAFAGACGSGTTSENFPTGPGSLQGTWANASSAGNDPIRTTDGEAPPLRPWAAELLNERVKTSAEGRPFAPASENCLPPSPPAMLLYPGVPIQILESPGYVTMLNGEPSFWRNIRIDQPHMEDPYPTFKGDSVGRWEGDSLVVDTIALNDKTTLDAAGTPHSEAMHVVERYRRVAKDVIEVAITIDDPEAFTEPWTTEVTLTPVDERLVETLCDDSQSALENYDSFGEGGGPRPPPDL